MNISIIIPNYNGADLLKKNIPKVFLAIDDFNSGEVEMIVVDDGSTDESLEVLAELAKSYKNLTFIRNEKNYGFSTTVNSGAKKATGDIFVLLNTDVTPEHGFLNKVVTHFGDDKVFAVGFMDKSIEGEKTVLRGRGIIRWYHGFVLHEWGSIDKTNTLWASGGSSAFRRTHWNTFNGLNELYNPFYWEDIDLSYRAIKAGYDIHFDKAIITTHDHEKGAIRKNNSQSNIETYAYRNQFLFFWLNISDLSLWIEHIAWMPINCINAIRDKNGVFFEGLLQALTRIPQIIFYRIRHSKKNKKSDKEILQIFHT